MVDDTDYPKRGIQTELIGKIYSHVIHSMMLGFKGLFIGITDGMSQMLLDFALVGEAGKKGNHGLKQNNLTPVSPRNTTRAPTRPSVSRNTTRARLH